MILNKLKSVFKRFFLKKKANIINFKGKGILNLIDVGSIGELPDPWNKNPNVIRKLLKFEPQDKSSFDDNIITIDTALWSINCKKEFYIYKGFNSTGSSLFHQNYAFVKANFDELKNIGDKYLAETWFDRSELIKTTTINCRTLDEILPELDISFDFLKIDAQGAEYEILQGAKNFLENNCIGLHLELFNIPLYKGIKLFDEVDQMLSSMNFKLIKKMDPHGSFNSQNDCLYLKNNIYSEYSRKYKVIKKIYNL